MDDVSLKDNMANNNNFTIGEIDYAILKSMIYDVKTIRDMINILQIRTIVIEKHIYLLLKEGFVNFQLDNFTITEKGNDIVYLFERDKSESVWRPIDTFIISTMKQRKEQKLKTYKMIDMILLVSMIILIILIIYFGIFR